MSITRPANIVTASGLVIVNRMGAALVEARARATIVTPDNTIITPPSIVMPRKRIVVTNTKNGIPDMAFINRIPIREIAGALGLRFGANGHIHCWNPARHSHGDRTASVGINIAFNTVKCFGNACYEKPMGPLDLVMNVRGVDVLAAAIFVSERFKVPYKPKGARLNEKMRAPRPYGMETPEQLLIGSGLWARMLPPTKALLPVLLMFAEKRPGGVYPVFDLTMSYAAMMRFAGLSSRSSVSLALRELREMGLLKQESQGQGPVRPTNSYILTPDTDALREQANTSAQQNKTEIAAERELRRIRKKKLLDDFAEIGTRGQKPNAQGR